MPKIYKKAMYDTLHGNMTLTRAEDRILKSPYYQRLRWIKQLGFTFYIYSGATHTRFSHALGVMSVMDQILRSINKSVSDDRLFDTNNYDQDVIFHRTMRLAAMLHDIGTFPLSHTIELAYINHWKKQKQAGQKKVMANHENLGSHIILNTDFEGGLTRILKDEGINPLELSRIISGTSNHMLANQLLHSDIDADRMDYLLRDAHHTGIKFGQYDSEHLIRNLTTAQVDGQEILCVNEAAVNMAEYFLISRYYWYSEIIEDGTGYKFDLIAAKIYEYFLENGQAHSFDELIQTISQKPHRYFTFNDSYFMAKVHEYLDGQETHPLIRELCEMLAFREAPKQIKIAPVEPTLITSYEHRQSLIKTVTEAAQWLENEIKSIDPNAWMIFDISNRDVTFTKDHDAIKRDAKGLNPLLSRDPVKILSRHGEPKLLIDVSNSLFSVLARYRNFIPRIYISPKTYELLEKRKVLAAMKARYHGIKVA